MPFFSRMTLRVIAGSEPGVDSNHAAYRSYHHCGLEIFRQPEHGNALRPRRASGTNPNLPQRLNVYIF